MDNHYYPSEEQSMEHSVDEGAFWHSNVALYHGYLLNEVVEVEHESNKYWLATIEYHYKQLLLLKWVGGYGEFWVDTSNVNQLGGCNLAGTYNEFSTTKRLFPPGYHLQPQIKSQFTLERPSKVLERPSLYNPANDPYSNIKTVDDLLLHEIEPHKDAFGEHHPTTTQSNEPATLAAIVKCKTKIDYGQEDVDELEAALQNLNDLDSVAHNELSESFNLTSGKPTQERKNTQPSPKDGSDTNPLQASDTNQQQQPQEHINLKSEKNDDAPIISNPDNSSLEQTNPKQTGDINQLIERQQTVNQTNIINHEEALKTCRTLQESAITNGRYFGIGENSNKVFFIKPKQFYELGGANHEKVLVPGTLLEVAHTIETDSGLQLCHWFAIVIKNVGGRLTLRWFLCDEPKFKQGRLEMKSIKSELVSEEEEAKSQMELENEEGKNDTPRKLSFESLTFCMNFCNPCIHSVYHGKTLQRIYRIPDKIRPTLEHLCGDERVATLEQTQMEFIFDSRRINLDKDRPIIDHILSIVRWMTPKYVDVTYGPDDATVQREVLLSTPKATKLYRGFIKRQLEDGVFEVHSVPITEEGEVIKFIYPYNSSYTILPVNWSNNNSECISVHPSRCGSPTSSELDINLHQMKESNADKAIDQSILDSSIRDTLQNIGIDAHKYSLLCEVPKLGCTISSKEENLMMEEKYDYKNDFNVLDPILWSKLTRFLKSQAKRYQCYLDDSMTSDILSKFKVMDHLEVVHPSSDVTMCLGRIRKIVYPLIWIQISADSYTVMPFNSTDLYPVRWSENNGHSLISLLPPRKRIYPPSYSDKKRLKRSKKEDQEDEINPADSQKVVYEREIFDLNSLSDKHSDIDYILNDKSMLAKIFFNHKCFTGPSLSKGKICSLPQYVGPGPLRLVMEEVVTKVISVAYVPPRILNDLSSKSFKDLLIARGMINTAPMEFKAKYQKRVHREYIQVCLNPDDVGLYCECLCEHLKCCYNLFGPCLYDGDDCPSHCRTLTKSNKFMKRATYYREKARLGEFISDNNGNKKNSENSSNATKTSRARYAGRDSSGSNSSSVSRSEAPNSCASSAGDEASANELKENLAAVEEMENEDEKPQVISREQKNDQVTTTSQQVITTDAQENGMIQENGIKKEPEPEPQQEIIQDNKMEQDQNITIQPTIIPTPTPTPTTTPTPPPPAIKLPQNNDKEFTNIELQDISPEEWSVEDVAEYLDWCRLDKFKPYMISEGVDGQALLLLDKVAIKEHFQYQHKSEYSQEEVGKLCRFVEFIKEQAAATSS